MACWRRKDGDNGVQLNVGKPFFMPNMRKPLKVLTELEETAEGAIGNRIDVLKQWSEGVTRDRKGMKMIANMIDVILQNVEKQDLKFDTFFRMAAAEDNKFLQDKILELLPPGWNKVSEKDGIFETQRYQNKHNGLSPVREEPTETTTPPPE